MCNGDVLTDLDLDAMVALPRRARRGGDDLRSRRSTTRRAFGVVPTHADGEVIAFVEKPPPGKAPTNWINAGTYVLEPSVLDRIPPRLNVSIERETFPRMLDEPGRLYAIAADAYWLDIGTPEKYLAGARRRARRAARRPARARRARGRARGLGAGRRRRSSPTRASRRRC